MTTSTTPPLPRRKQPLLNCAIGCGAVLIVLIVAITGLYFWAVSPGAQIPTQRVLGPESLAFLRIEKIGYDEGFQSLAAEILLDIQDTEIQRTARQVPFYLQWLNQAQRSTPAEVIRNLERDLPTDITLTVEAAPDSQTPVVAAAVNLSRYPRLLRWTFYWIAGQFSSEMQDFPGKVEFVENTAVWAQTPETMRIVLDRTVQVSPKAGASTQILQLLQSADPRWDLYLAAENREGLMQEAARLLQQLPEDFPLDVSPALADQLPSLESFWLGVDIASKELVEVQWEVTAKSELEARKWAALIQEFARINQPGPDNPLRMESSVLREGSRVSLQLRFSEVATAVVQLAAQAQAKAEERARERKREREQQRERQRQLERENQPPSKP